MGRDDAGGAPWLSEYKEFDESPPDLVHAPGNVQPKVESGGSNRSKWIVASCTLLVIAGLSTAVVVRGNSVSHPAVLYASPSPSPSPAAVNGPVVHTKSGPVLGVSYGSSQGFLGIPFAQPPLGPLRFMPPKPASSWTDLRSATALSPVCPQSHAYGYNLTKPNGVEQSEDCLYINVWRPASTSSTPRSVVAFIHGGGCIVGSASQPLYNGTRFVENDDIILVTFNYRLGALGFLAHPDLETGEGTSGNLGMLDQQLALSWIANNIAAFGGNPDRSAVTLMGQSAGSQQVFDHVAFRGSSQYFSKIVGFSGTVSPVAYPFVGPTSYATAQTTAKSFATDLQCDTSDISSTPDATIKQCLQSASVSDILAAQAAYATMWIPTIDPVYFSGQPALTAYTNGTAAAVLSGAVLGNMMLDASIMVTFFDGNKQLVSDAVVQQTLGNFYGAHKQAVYDHYGSITPWTTVASTSNFVQLAQVITDVSYNCASKKVSNILASAKVPTYNYRDTHRMSFAPSFLHASHFQDLPLIFGVPCFITCIHTHGDFTSSEINLSEQLMSELSGFAKTSSIPSWTHHDASSPDGGNVIHDTGVSWEDSLYNSTTCDFWETLFPW